MRVPKANIENISYVTIWSTIIFLITNGISILTIVLLIFWAGILEEMKEKNNK